MKFIAKKMKILYSLCAKMGNKVIKLGMPRVVGITESVLELHVTKGTRLS